MNSSAIFIAESAAFLTCAMGFDFELILIQHSFVNGCLTMTPAKSVLESFRSSCWMIYRIPTSVSVIERLISFSSELITCAFMYSGKAPTADINHASRARPGRPLYRILRAWGPPWAIGMGESMISEIRLEKSKDEYLLGENVEVRVKFAVGGDVREAFNEENWTRAYNKNDVSFKMKYGVKLTSGGLRKHGLGRTIDTYRKASIFWTRNPKLVNPMKDRRIWVQVAKNFEPFIRLSEEEVRQELFDFDEKFVFAASDLGRGRHKIGAEVFASWQRHEYTEPGTVKNHSGEAVVAIN